MTDTHKYDELLNALISGNISDGDRYILEKKALDDSMLFDAIEGLTTHSDADHHAHIRSIQEKIKKVKDRRLSRRFIFPVAIAASLLVLFTVGNRLINKSSDINDTEETMVMNESESIDEDGTEVEIPAINPQVDHTEAAAADKPINQKQEPVPVQETSPAKKKATPPEVATAPPPSVEKKVPTSTAKDSREVEVPAMAEGDVKKNKMDTDPGKRTRERSPLPDNLNLPLTTAQTSKAMAGVNIPIINNELNQFLSEKYKATHGSLIGETALTFGVIFVKENQVQSVRVVTGPADIGNQFIPFLKEYDLWKMEDLILGKEYRFSFISE